TATASKMVQQEIVERLGLQDPKLLVQDFDRPNLSLAVTRHAGDADKRRAVLDEVAGMPGPGLLYTATRKDTEAYRDELLSRGVRAEAYHSGRNKKDRTGIYERFMDDDFDVLVATTAFGMGIDKPNVRFVIHADIPDSLDSYYQEIGRAGRDGEAAHTMLHYRPEDLGLRRFFVAKHPDKEALDRILTDLSGSGDPVPAKQLRERLELPARKLTGLLNLLLAAGVAQEDDGGFRAVSDVDRERAVEAAAETAGSHERIDESRIEMTRQYAETDACRRQFLLGYFGQQLDEPCGNCDNCASGSARQTEDQSESTGFEAEVERFPLQAAVVHKEWGSGTVMRHEDDRITVFFETEGYKSLALEVLEDSDILVPRD
ncbi:helicase-related protein, partial [Arthrobacter sp. H14]|uniref:helicase-related protein n=1 Tax=Arthrobacter sp. H14 TaxID=1312959 RepID=UPI00055E505C